MTADAIPLRFAGSRRIARLRELTGRDEHAVLGTNTANAIELLSALLENESPGDTELYATDLVAADRDRLLAAVYERAYGDRIESTLTCAHCGQQFDLFFSLRRLIETVNKGTSETEWRSLGDGRFETSDGLRFRLPTGTDELALAGLTASEVEALLLDRCLESEQAKSGISLEELLEKVAPLLDLELIAKCAECGHVHTIQFDIQTYVLGAILAERRRLLAEINRIASSYSWSLDEILSLRRSDRRKFVELIENEYVT